MSNKKTPNQPHKDPAIGKKDGPKPTGMGMEIRNPPTEMIRRPDKGSKTTESK